MERLLVSLPKPLQRKVVDILENSNGPPPPPAKQAGGEGPHLQGGQRFPQALAAEAPSTCSCRSFRRMAVRCMLVATPVGANSCTAGIQCRARSSQSRRRNTVELHRHTIPTQNVTGRSTTPVLQVDGLRHVSHCTDTCQTVVGFTPACMLHHVHVQGNCNKQRNQTRVAPEHSHSRTEGYTTSNHFGQVTTPDNYATMSTVHASSTRVHTFLQCGQSMYERRCRVFSPGLTLCVVMLQLRGWGAGSPASHPPPTRRPGARALPLRWTAPTPPTPAMASGLARTAPASMS
jgi:hypothetical protein